METCNALFLNSNAKLILHIFNLEEMIEKSENTYCWDILQGPPIPL